MQFSWEELDWDLTSLYKTERLSFTKPEDIDSTPPIELQEYVDIDYFDSFNEAAINEFIRGTCIL